MPRFLAPLSLSGLLVAPLVARAEVELKVQPKPASVTPAQERAMMAKMAPLRAAAERFQAQADKNSHAAAVPRPPVKLPPGALNSGADGSAKATPAKNKQHGKIIEVHSTKRRSK